MYNTSVNVTEAQKSGNENFIRYVGVNLRGHYTSIQDTRYATHFPDNYYDRSFRLISEGNMNHIRYVYYWEAYERNPAQFMNELKKVADLADKYKLKVIYDSHQFHTSSWLDPNNGTGFPPDLFKNDPNTPYGGGGTTVDNASKVWWNKWWNRNITDSTGKDGWVLYSQFLKKIIRVVNDHKSTLGYEILNEPQVHSSDQWEKIGKYNSFITDQLRKTTQKTVVYSMNVPITFKDPSIHITPQNLAKMAPNNKTNVVFKISIYGIPLPDSYQGKKLDILTQAGKIVDVPIYVGEWNEVTREEKINENGNMMFSIDPLKSNLDQTKATKLIQAFKKIGVWGIAFWNWNYVPNATPNFNLMNVTDDGHIKTTKYFNIISKASFS